MNNVQPIIDPTTHYQVVIRGRVDEEWLRSFCSPVEISVEETKQTGELSVIDVCTDQSGIVGLVRRLHGLGMTILQLQVVSDGGKAAEIEVQR